jgi:hypothetical protein
MTVIEILRFMFIMMIVFITTPIWLVIVFLIIAWNFAILFANWLWGE